MTELNTPEITPQDLQAARQRLFHCVSSLLASQPFYGSVAIHMLPPTPDTERATIAADGVNIRYNPTWVNQATTTQLRNAVAHVTLACALKHHTRRGARTYQRWQRASRLVTQHLLLEQQLADPQFGDGIRAAVERAYDALPPDPDHEPMPAVSLSPLGSAGNAAGGSGAESGQQPDQSTAGSGDKSQTGQQPDQDAQAAGGPSSGGKGSAGGDRYDDPDQQGEVMDHPQAGPTAGQQDLRDLETTWDDVVQQSLQIAKAQGNRPGNVAELVERSQNPLIDWKDELAAFMTDHTPTDRSWNAPDRRFIHRGIYLPGLHANTIQSICFAVDTSGSLDHKALTQTWDAISEICEEIEPEYVRVIQCDTTIQADDTYDQVDLPEAITAHGRGGSAFTPVFDLVDDDPPAFLIYLTDLYCNRYPQEPPDYPVLWLCNHQKPAADPPFGRRLNLPELANA